MSAIYILKRTISDIDWECERHDNLLMSHDRLLLKNIATDLEKKHKDDEHVFEYCVVEGPTTIDSMEDFEARKNELLDYWEE